MDPLWPLLINKYYITVLSIVHRAPPSGPGDVSLMYILRTCLSSTCYLLIYITVEWSEKNHQRGGIISWKIAWMVSSQISMSDGSDNVIHSSRYVGELTYYLNICLYWTLMVSVCNSFVAWSKNHPLFGEKKFNRNNCCRHVVVFKMSLHFTLSGHRKEIKFLRCRIWKTRRSHLVISSYTT
jgi:hypothetical protein